MTHSELVKALAKPGDKIVAEMTPESANRTHMALGICGEVAELLAIHLSEKYPFMSEEIDQSTYAKKAHIIEELGDIEFYLEGLNQSLGRTDSIEAYVLRIELGNKGTIPIQNVLAILSVLAGRILDSCKKESIYVKKIDTYTLASIISTFEFYLAFAYLHYYRTQDITREACIEGNITKLMKRYEGGNYSNQAAQNRADKEE